MRITRLYLRNYRVYEEPLELEIPGGLVGIYGVNGSGKSTLVESILWTLFGRARTNKGEIRTSGLLGDCVTEVEFEHEGHLYVFRRVIAGQAASVQAQAHCDGSQVAEGVTDTRLYVHGLLGMDDAAFRASVFAEQNQLSAFSNHDPAERRKLVLGLLGVAPLDRARDEARKDARESRTALERLRAVLPDLGQLEERLASAETTADEAKAQAAVSRLAEEAARAAADQAEAELEGLRTMAAEHEGLVRDGQARRDEVERATQRIRALRTEDAELLQARDQLAPLKDRAAGLAGAEEHLRLARAVVEAEKGLAALGDVVEAAPPDPEPAATAREQADAERARLADLEGELRALKDERGRAAAAVSNAVGLSREEDCPLCGQPLGTAFEQVRAHRAAELDQAEQRLLALDARRGPLVAGVQAGTAASQREDASLLSAREAWASYQRARDRRADAQDRLGAALAEALTGGMVGPAGGTAPIDWSVQAAELAREVEDRRRAAEEYERLKGRLERAPFIAAELAEERDRESEASQAVEALREKVRALGFRQESLDLARAARSRASKGLADATSQSRSAELAAAQASTSAGAAARALEDARHQHARAEEMTGDARHVGRAADLLSGFRDTVVATIGPTLSAQAAELFGELTDHEYERLEVDPETYEIKLGDQGILYGMGRFSGSETDLANLALRVAVSQQVELQSGGAVGLLVLDEVFGPLDDDRKERMLGALESLSGRFRQILVITHDGDIKEQLPSAIEVVKLPGRRATARLV